MRAQPRFTVVTFVLVALTAFAVLSRLLAPYIVAPSNRRLLNAKSSYLVSAVHQHIAWYPLSDRAFQDARRYDRPILLVVGAPWSLTSRQMDSDVFGNVSVQKLLSREFICIRVDAVETPDWMSAYLPFARASMNLYSDFGIWMLDSQAQFFRPIAVHAAQRTPSETEFTDEIAADLTALQKQRDVAIEAGDQLPPSNAQQDDLARLNAQPERLSPDLVIYRQALLQQTASSPHGGFPIGGIQRLWPSAWAFLLATQGSEAATSSISPLLVSPTVDWVDGGFFYGSTDPAWKAPAFDKVAVLNAEMCVLLARLAKSEPAGPYLYFAQKTFDSIADQFVDTQGLIRPCRIGDEYGRTGRSSHSSFPPRNLHAVISGADALLKNKDENWAIRHLNLRPTNNPSVTPYVSDLSDLNEPSLSRVIQKLHVGAAPPVFDEEVTLDTVGPTAARLLQAARILGDPVRIQKADDIIGRLDFFRRGNNVEHELVVTDRAQPVLGDYLGYADAALEDFLCFGRVASLQTGAGVLKQGLTLFGYPGAACYLMAGADGYHKKAPDSNTPQLCDDAGESTNAKAIRLAWAYSCLLSQSSVLSDRALSADLHSRANTCVTQFADISVAGGPYTAGYAMACALVTDDTFVLCAGPDPNKMTAAMVQRETSRLVAPVAGPVFPNLFKKPGYYVSRRGQLIGPLTFQAAAALLPPTLFINQ